MNWELYIPLSLVMFFEYGVWGAWSPVLAARLLGPLKMTAKQTGWIYATMPIGCIFAPLISGQMADQWFAIKWILAVAHLAGAVLLFIAGRQERFWPLLGAMFCYSMCFAATLPLVNSILFDQIQDVPTQGKVFIWAPVAWALAGYILTAWRWAFKTGEEGRDCLFLAAILSLAMALSCLTLPTNELAATGEIPILKAFGQLQDTNLLSFLIISMVVAGLMQFYFLGTAQFMLDKGVPGKNVPASMAIAQVAQSIGTFALLALFLGQLGFKWTLVIGAGCWAVMYIVYTGLTRRWIIIVAQSLHGLAYVFFIIAGQIFMESSAAPEIRSSMQALVFAATIGVGLFLGTQLAGIVMDRFSVAGRFEWRKVWAVPGLIAVAAMAALMILFQDLG